MQSSGKSKQTAAKQQNAPKNLVKQQTQVPKDDKKIETTKKEFQKSSSQLFVNTAENGSKVTPRGDPSPGKNIKESEEKEQIQTQQEDQNEKPPNNNIEADQNEDKTPGDQLIESQSLKDDDNNSNSVSVIDSKYGDQKIDISDIIKDNLQNLPNQLTEDYDPTRPQELQLGQNTNEPLPSYSNRVNIEEFAVGNYKEFQLKDELAHLIERYNKKFNGDAKKPNMHTQKVDTKDTRYSDKMIINPIAVPDPNSSEGNFSWMYLVTPYYNNLVKEFNQNQMENHVLNQHFEYYVQMQEEKNLLNEEFELLQKSERAMIDKMNNVNSENQILDDKMRNYERNLNEVQPDRIREVNDKLENLNNILHAKDGVIDQLLNEITLVKNEKDDLQNESLFKKQRIENYNMQFNTKELEYQRLWEESQNLKGEIRGDNNDSQMIQRENEILNREIALLRDEIGENQQIYEINQNKIQEGKGLLQDYENRLRYANDVIMSLDTEHQQVQLDLAQAKATVEGQNRAYNELRNNYYMISQSGDHSGKLAYSNSSSAMISMPKVIMPSNYYRPSAIASKNTINLMPSTSKAMSQQVAPSNIKSYLSIKKATIDLTSDLSAKRNNASRDQQKVRFSLASQGSSPTGGLANLPATTNNQRNTIELSSQHQRRSDSLDLRIERRNMKGLTSNADENHKRQNSNVQQVNERVSSVNRNFIDTMSGIMGMSDDQQKFVNIRSSAASNSFPLKRIDIEQSQPNSPQKLISFQGSPDKDYRNMETDISTEYYNKNNLNDSANNGRASINSNMQAQSPLKNNVTNRGAPGNRNAQPQQMSSVKQRQHPMSTRNQQPQQPQVEEEKYRQPTWDERMSQLPKQSAYKSSISFGYDGITTKEVLKEQHHEQRYEQQIEHHPFQIARDYEVEMNAYSEDDPQAKVQIAKFKQQKIFELQDQHSISVKPHSRSFKIGLIAPQEDRIRDRFGETDKENIVVEDLRKQEMASLSNQIKAKLQSIGSPKIKLAGQSPINTNIQRVPTVGKIHIRDGNTSQSPEDHTGSRGGATAIQRIQMKNVAFIPAKAQSPSSQNLQFTSCVPNLTNFNTSTVTTSSNDQQSKVSPQRLMTANGNKMIIPANQIKLAKKDGASPSPETRQPSKIGLTNQQNMNPNITMPGGSCQSIKPSNVAANGPKQSARISNNTKINQQQMSDDETTVMSDSEDKVQNLTSMKQDPSQNNFNRPKLNTNSQSQISDNVQKSQRNGHDQQNRIKIISQNKIRQSPSPPPNQVLKLQQQSSVANIQIQIKQQQSQQQQTPQPQLATDFIKEMINQSRTNNILNNGGNNLQKKIGGITQSLKIKNDNNNINTIIANTNSNLNQQNFVKDMKKHGIIRDIQDVNTLNQMLSENSPVRQDESQISQQTSVNNHHRNYSPPPNFCQGPTNISKIQTKETIALKEQQQQPQQIKQKPIAAEVVATQDQVSPQNVSIQGDTSNIQQQQQQEGQASVFQFPFQRRARSLSLPKQEIIQSKLGQKQNGQPTQQQIPSGTNHQHPQKQNKSPSPNGEESRRNGPVVAKVNFVIAQKGALGNQYKQENEAVFERNKEVDEWLMGSGESNATAGSNNSVPLQQLQQQLIIQQIKVKQSELERPIQPGKQNEGDDDNSLDGEEEEDWMFKTFNGPKKGQKNAAQSSRPNISQQPNAAPGRSRLNEQTFEDVLEEDSPFDMAPEMSKVIPKKGQFMFDDLGQDCNDISQYIEQIDHKRKMLSKFVASFALKQQAARGLRMTPQFMNKSHQMVFLSQRGFTDRLGLDSQASEIALDGKSGEVSLWQEKAKQQETALVLKDNDQINKYVISIVKNYFRTTKKAKVELESSFKDHGLDSMDVIELVIQVEDELGYVIDAENLTRFKTPKHFVNFISQMEAYRNEFHKLPHQDNHVEFSFRTAFPGLPGEKKAKDAHHH